MKLKLVRYSRGDTKCRRKNDSHDSVEWEIIEKENETIYRLEDGAMYIHDHREPKKVINYR